MSQPPDDEKRPEPSDSPVPPPENCVVEVDGQRFDVRVFRETPSGETPVRPRKPRSRFRIGPTHGAIVAAIPGNVMQVHVANGDVVEAGHILCVIEAMKMQNEITAPAAGVVEALAIAEGDLVAGGQELMRIEAAEPTQP